MANPNIMNMTNLLGQNAGLALTTSYQTIVSNAASSNKIFRVHSLICSNIDGANAAALTCELKIGTGYFRLATTVTVPPDSTLILIGRDSPVYVKEDGLIRAFASQNGDLHMVISYDEIS